MDVRTWALKNVGRTILNLRADPLLTSPIFPSENCSVQLYPGASVEIEQDRMEEEQILHLRRKGLLIATSLVRLLYTSSSSSHSSSSSSASSRSSSSSSQSSASSSSSSSTTPAPRIILMIDGLTGGNTFLGLGNGVHTVTPTIYQTLPYEYWKAGGGNSSLYLAASSPTSIVALKESHSFVFDIFFKAYVYSTGYSRHGSISTAYLPFTSGPVTGLVRNRCFGNITTDRPGWDDVHISWQRAANWPANP